ncbi:Alcohol dehydrogenase NADP+, partial [Hondaea fermentalgiana]
MAILNSTEQTEREAWMQPRADKKDDVLPKKNDRRKWSTGSIRSEESETKMSSGDSSATLSTMGMGASASSNNLVDDEAKSQGASSAGTLSAASVPLLGFGTFNEFKDGERVKEAVQVAIKEGYRMIDCAALYGNEKEVGEALSSSLQAGDVEREDLFVCSKLWCWDAAPEDVEDACRRTLADLQVEYLDNYMMHWPNRMSKDSKLVSKDYGGKFEYEVVHDGTDIEKIMETYHAMERLVELGLVRSLGVSNMGPRTLQGLLARCEIRPLVLEVEMHPYLAQPSLVELCQTEGINVIAYSPLGKVGYRDEGHPSLLEDETIVEVAAEVGKTPGQVLLRWGIQRGTSVIPKSLTPSRIASNRDVLDWRLTKPQMDRINALDRGFRFVSPPWFDLDTDSEYCVRGGHPGTQAFRTPCEVDDNGCFRNKFER